MDMTQLLNLRQNAINFYKKYEVIINYVIKFIFALFVIMRVNTLGLYREEFGRLFSGATGFAFTILISLIFTVAPPTWALLLVALIIGVQLSAVLNVAVFVFH